VFVLSESSLYRDSWKDAAASFFPSRGLQFCSVDIFRSGGGGGTEAASLKLKSLEQSLVTDLSHLGDVGHKINTDPTTSPAHVVLIARGPIQCLVAQYFLESLPLAGLVLVDPLLLPDDGRAGKLEIRTEEDTRQWKKCLSDFVSLLECKTPQTPLGTHPSSIEKECRSPFMFPGDTTELESTSRLELALLRSLESDEQCDNSRPLKLEPGAVPVLVLYNGDHAFSDYFRICSEQTAASHCVGKGDQVPLLKIKENIESSGPDLDWTLRSIHEWYDESI
jgi:hypothetical protein